MTGTTTTAPTTVWGVITTPGNYFNEYPPPNGGYFYLAGRNLKSLRRQF